MPDITIAVPNIGLKAYFKFRDPINTFITNKYNLDTDTTKLIVSSIISMKDMIKNDLRDPYTNIYLVAAISEAEYKKDLLDDIVIISFTFIDNKDIERTFRVPINYIEEISDVTNIDYAEKLIVISLNKLPLNLDTTMHFTDLLDFIETRLGIVPEIKEVTVGNVELVTTLEHTTRETVRTNMVTVHKTNEIKLSELQLAYNELLNRLVLLQQSIP
ncbi:MAG: hypothetical protein ACD_33C00014G0009 [uncultured bacterium]|nr:MAG: hypothetical protein ACD_33C00014G0009 [uncultured bacterium]